MTSIHVHADDLDAAEASLERATAIRSQLTFIAPWHESTYALARLQVDTAQIWAARSSGQAPAAALVRRARRSRRAALANARVVATNRVAIFAQVGTLAWLLGDVTGAKKWWRRGIKAAEAMGAGPELGRTYVDISRCLRMPGAAVSDFRGIDATGYEERARAIADDLGLEWDRARVDTVTQQAIGA